MPANVLTEPHYKVRAFLEVMLLLGYQIHSKYSLFLSSQTLACFRGCLSTQTHFSGLLGRFSAQVAT